MSEHDPMRLPIAAQCLTALLANPAEKEAYDKEGGKPDLAPKLYAKAALAFADALIKEAGSD